MEDRDPFLPDVTQEEMEQWQYEVKGISLSLAEIEVMQRGTRLVCEQYGSGFSTWEQVIQACNLYQRLETLKQYARKPV